MSHPIDDYIYLFENLSTDKIKSCADYVAPDIQFIDPFNQINSLAAFQALLHKTLTDVTSPKFHILYRYDDHNKQQTILKWHFTGHITKLGPMDIEGFSEIHWNNDMKVNKHIDYWDSAQHIYMKIPLLGRIIKFLRQRFSI